MFTRPIYPQGAATVPSAPLRALSPAQPTIQAPPRIAVLPVLQGLPGPKGNPGSDLSRYGYIRLIPASSAGVLFTARAPVAMAIDPTQTFNSLAGPFAGWEFWTGAQLNARAVGDAYAIRLSLQVISSVAGGTIVCDATVNGATTAVDTDEYGLGAPAGVPQSVTFKLALYPQATFVQSGAQVFITPTVPVVVTNSKLIIQPTEAG